MGKPLTHRRLFSQRFLNTLIIQYEEDAFCFMTGDILCQASLYHPVENCFYYLGGYDDKDKELYGVRIDPASHIPKIFNLPVEFFEKEPEIKEVEKLDKEYLTDILYECHFDLLNPAIREICTRPLDLLPISWGLEGGNEVNLKTFYSEEFEAQETQV